MPRRSTLPLAALLAATALACSESHRVDASPADALVPIGTVDVSYGFPRRLVPTSDGFLVVTGREIPDGVVPMVAWDIGVDASAASHELSRSCRDEWSLHPTPALRLACHEQSTEGHAISYAPLSRLGEVGEAAGPIDVSGRVDLALLDGDTAWIVDRWPGDPTTSLVVTGHDLDSGRPRTAAEHDYDWMLQRPVLRPGTLGPWLATVVSEPGRGPVLTIRRLGAPSIQRWPTCVAHPQRDGLAVMERSADEVVIVELCDGTAIVSTIDVGSGAARSAVLEGAASSAAWGPPALALANGRIVVAHGTEVAHDTRIRVLDDELAVRSQAVVPGVLGGLAGNGRTVAVLAGTSPPRVTLLREPDRL
ncbi:MAG TPA: hypothetical protein RMH99_26305 [Sandaracinaceae bacterium LLY-WYZ-13_1]|nr:hypothetical protein [Sandaracinaceae bacterium LLY-WYZ-13_1]